MTTYDDPTEQQSAEEVSSLSFVRDSRLVPEAAVVTPRNNNSSVLGAQTNTTSNIRQRSTAATGSTRPSSSQRTTMNRRASAHHADETFTSLTKSHHKYQWRMFAPNRRHFGQFLNWLVTGQHSSTSSFFNQDDSKEKIQNLAKTLSLLRFYKATYGMPQGGSPKEQTFVLVELCKRLYASGVPIWVLEPVMNIASTGLTGLQDFDFFLLPASGIIIPPPQQDCYYSQFFQMQGGFCLYRINLYEKVLARLASFSTNTRTINSVPDESFSRLLMQDVQHYRQEEEQEDALLLDKEAIAKEILDLASRSYGLFFLTRVEEILTQQQQERLEENAEHDDESGGGIMSDGEASGLSYNSFWTVDESIREFFTRLATIEAAECLDAIERSPGLDVVWPRHYVVLFRALSSAGSSALWFNGSWQDMLLSGGIAGCVTLLFQTNTNLWKNQRMIFEVVVSWVVGLTAGLIAIRLPETTCFSGIALASMIDYLRGFGIVFSIMEVMSKNTMSGSSDLIEAIIFSFLISMSILFGLGAAENIMGIQQADSHGYMDCGYPLPEPWFLLILPLASLGWAAGFKPAYRDLPLMTVHGIIAYVVSYAVEHATNDSYIASFVAALTTSTVAGLVSRFTGRQALGDTFTGLFALVPGIYITEGFFAFALGKAEDISALFFNLVLKAVVIGVGSWCGTLLCAPTNLGTNIGILNSVSKKGTGNGNLGAVLYI